MLKFLKFLKINMDIYVLHSYFHAINMDDVELFLDILGWTH
jgi:hypothetical protein